MFEDIIKKIRGVTIVKLVRKLPISNMAKDKIIMYLYYYLNLKPNMIVMDISSKCNAKCPFCSHSLMDIKGSYISEDLFYKSIDEAKKLGIKSCKIFATGEPLLHPNIDEFIEYLKANNFYVFVSTNGVYLDKHFKSLSKVDLVNFSVEGWDKKSFAYYKQGCDFDKVTTNIKNFNIFLQNENTNRPPVTNIQVMVNKDTELNSFLKVWGPLVNEIVYSSCHNAIKIDENMKISHLKFDDYLEKNIYDFEYNEGFKYCGYPFTDIVISSDGAPIMCCSDFNYTTKTSSLISTSLKDFLDSKERKLRQKQFITQQLDICSNCSSFYDLTEESKIEYNKKLKTT